MAVPPLTLDTEADALASLVALDARLDQEVGPRRTLAPERERATSLESLARRLMREESLSPELADVLARGLEATALATLEHFPENIFWDLDGLASSVIRDAWKHTDPAASLAAAFDDIASLYAVFGRATAIRFRYVHDFVYGFDWAKWVRRDPAARAGVGPFDRVFLRALLARGEELLDLIERDDPEYPRLRDEGSRSPFPFSREPEDEARLHRSLVGEALIPVRAWCIDPEPVWDRPFAELRAARAAAMT